ncbi:MULTISPECIES: hypothetical protein [Hyphomonas]|uniref:SnoaL-like domain-containing protein n=2 Tax=Hyphomonas adhaerens TaxID=81029 RepID=A0A069E631_9PROT|nr:MULTISPECIES: hypothetical protein [Hyphomonas]KCZ85553.1 hypothetical protein HAD_07710 [Hyphomonas adhaerens MHS-3]MBB41364.1 hypothetical protein [Hyphomonas sp.]HAE26898.1 hypothetical protein [Hyphomonas adhaerens]|tara:strand:- start:984 stop:1463 length:480 start_codon:yes stop_codon:yes gene_type:complete
MAPPITSSTLSIVSNRGSTSAETKVKTRVFAWCSTWSSVNGAFLTEQLRTIAIDEPVRMVTDFGRRMSVSVSLDAYAAFWSQLLSETFSEWSLVIDSPIDVMVGNNRAIASFNARLQGTTHEGGRASQRQHVQQVFKIVDGTWRLAQEQMTISPENACL